MVGRTNNTEWKLDASSPHAVIGPRTERFIIQNMRFYNYNWNNAAVLGSCSHCYHPQATDSGARTIHTRNLTFDATVERRIKYGYPYKAIFRDHDGTLTGKGANSYASFFQYHLMTAGGECEHLAEEYNGVTCDNSVQIKRVAFFGAAPASKMMGMGFRIKSWDDEIIDNMDNETLTAYVDNKTDYGMAYFKESLKPSNSWTIGYVTGYKYKIHWGQTGLDWDTMSMSVTETYETTDLPLYFVHNHTEAREVISLKVDGVQMENDTIPDDEADYRPGQFVHYNDTQDQMLEWVVNGQDKDEFKEVIYTFTATKCLGNCGVEAIVEAEEVEAEFRLWSDVTNWPNETLPVEGDTIEIVSGWKMILDIENPPKFHTMNINGILIFSDEMDIHLQCINMWVRAGELHIGNETHPHQHMAQITLLGEKEADSLVFDNAIESGNKVIVNTNLIKMFGKSRTINLARLHETVNKGDTQI